MRALQVTASDSEVLAKRQQHLGYSAHADAADANEVNVSESSKKQFIPRSWSSCRDVGGLYGRPSAGAPLGFPEPLITEGRPRRDPRTGHANQTATNDIAKSTARSVESARPKPRLASSILSTSSGCS